VYTYLVLPVHSLLCGLFCPQSSSGWIFGLLHLSHVTRGLVVSLATLGLTVFSREARSRSFKIGESAFVFEQIHCFWEVLSLFRGLCGNFLDQLLCRFGLSSTQKLFVVAFSLRSQF
jgi:hypothetical protein